MALDIGTLVVNVTANTSGLQSELAKANRAARESADILRKQFDAAGGAIGSMAEKIGQAGSSINKMFGSEATQGMRKFGDSIGLTEKNAKGLKGALEGAEGAVRLVGLALQPTTLIVAGLALGIGAVRIAWMEMTKGVSDSTGGWRDTLRGWLDVWLTSFEESLRTVRLWATSVLDTMDSVARGMGRIPGMGLNSRVLAGAAGLGRSAVDSIGETESTLGAMRQSNINGTLLPIVERSVTGDVSSLGSGVFEGMKASLASFVGILKGVFGDMTSMFQPAAKEAKKAKDASLNYGKLYLELVEFLTKQEKEKFEKRVADNKRLSDAYSETMREEEEDLRKRMEMEKRISEARQKAQEEEIAEAKQRWQAVAGGRFGRAAGLAGREGAAGVVGAGLDIFGGALSAGPLTGAALQGASAGGQAAGPWGALIGALIGLATKTSTFNDTLAAIESILGDLLPIINQVFKPIAAAITGLSKILHPILGLVEKLIANSPLGDFLESLNDVLAPLMKLLSNLVDSLDMTTFGANQNVNIDGNNASFSDWITGTAALTALGNEIGKAGGAEATAEDVKNYQEAMRENERRNQVAIEAALKRQAEAKQAEIDMANRAAAALKELADSVQNSVQGYKLAAVMYAAGDRVGGSGAMGNGWGNE